MEVTIPASPSIGARLRAPALAHALLLGGVVALVACTQPGPESKPGARPVPPPAAREPVSLELNGFNYTDLYIDSFCARRRSRRECPWRPR